MVDDTFVFTILNLSPSFFDIESVTLSKLDGTLPCGVIEDGETVYEESPFKLHVSIRNTGQTPDTKDIALYNEAGELAREAIFIPAGTLADVYIDNSGSGFTNPVGATINFTLKSE